METYLMVSTGGVAVVQLLWDHALLAFLTEHSHSPHSVEEFSNMLWTKIDIGTLERTSDEYDKKVRKKGK
ncbi:Dynein heavy chain 10, axonemal, partial [Perkinsus olseni]